MACDLRELLEQALYKLRDAQETFVDFGLTNLDREWWADLTELTDSIDQRLSEGTN